MNLESTVEQKAPADRTRALPAGAVKWEGCVREALQWVTDEQLKDERLWERLEKQFDYKYDDDGGWRGEFWGKQMRGASLICAVTGDRELYALLEQSVRQLLDRQEEDGRIASCHAQAEFANWDMWCRKYVMLGCFYFLDICEDEDLGRRIVTAMQRHADCILRRVGPGAEQIPITQTSAFWGGLNSSSILEPMVWLYKLTGEQRYLDFAAYIVEQGGSANENIFEAALQKNKYPYQYADVKAYEMMSCFEGLLEYYRVTGIEACKAAVLNFIDLVAESDITLIGCAGCTHELFDHSAVRQFDRTATGIMQETCVTVTWMKLCWQAFRLTGDCRYAEQIEWSMFNALLGTLNTGYSLKNSGMVFDSYSPLLLQTRGRFIGGLKQIDGGSIYGCCTAIGAAGIGLMGAFPVTADADGIRINTFVAGTARVPVADGTVWVTMETAYPAAGEVTIRVAPGGARTVALYIRIPSFSKQTVLAVDGTVVPCVPGEYAVIRREWTGHETVTLTLDMALRVITPAMYGAEGEPFAAVAAGPLVLARDVRFGEDIARPIRLPDEAALRTTATPVTDPAFPTRVCWRVPVDGGNITLADYASCGKTWDKHSLMTAWLPIEQE